MPKNGRVAEPGFKSVAPGNGVIMMPPVSVCHQVSTTGQRRSPTTPWYHSQASGLIGSPTVPRTRRLARDVARDKVVALAHQLANGRGRGVEDVDLVLVHDLPEPGRVRVGRHALEHQRGGAVGERSVDDVRMPGDPADVGGTPVDVAVVVVEDMLVGHGGVQQVAAGAVLHTLRFAGGTGGVEDEQRILGVHHCTGSKVVDWSSTSSW